MAPEQLTDRVVSVATDVWGLGQFLFELLANKPAYPARTHGELWELFFRGPPDLTTLRADVPPELVAIVASCLQREAEKRPSSLAALGLELAQFGSLEARALADAIRVLMPHESATSGRPSLLPEAGEVERAHAARAETVTPRQAT
jgi:serine/threonine protein kinase